MNSQLASLLDKFFLNLKIIPGSDHCRLQRKYLQELNTEAAGVLRNFAKFTGKHPCQSFFFGKVAGLSLQIYSKKDSGTGVFL